MVIKSKVYIYDTGVKQYMANHAGPKFSFGDQAILVDRKGNEALIDAECVWKSFLVLASSRNMSPEVLCGEFRKIIEEESKDAVAE